MPEHPARHDIDGERADVRLLLRASGQILEAAVPGVLLVAGALGVVVIGLKTAH
ncbi:hypothetical protein [Amycolatopsis sp. MEPSY49]|uniref:hypothetical protein n=1 Tax=Amycolatopsis sp. MEPSY49 TaxID=3151600 RepID=UPI003EF669F7